MMKRIDSMELWTEACLDTPIVGSPRHSSEQEAFRWPGNHVKSRELDAGVHSFPKYHGILVNYDEAGDQVLVRSIGSPVSEPGTVWVGTISEYAKMWRCD